MRRNFTNQKRNQANNLVLNIFTNHFHSQGHLENILPLSSLSGYSISLPVDIFRIHQVRDLWDELVNSSVSLHMKNPTALAMKHRIVKVSNLSSGVRCDKEPGNHSRCVNCASTP